MGHILVDGLIPDTQLKFLLNNIHFHTPSEHYLEAKQYSIEVHFVHSLDSAINATAISLNRTKLVIGVLFDATVQVTSPFLASLGISSNNAANIDVKRFLTNEINNEAYYYEGSLTTPTCDEVVNWVVMKDIAGCTPGQLQNFTKFESGNFRVLMPLNGRTISYFRNEIPKEDDNSGLYSVLAVIVACIFAFIVIFI